MEFRELGEAFTEFLKFLAPKTMRQKLKEAKAERNRQRADNIRCMLEKEGAKDRNGKVLLRDKKMAASESITGAVKSGRTDTLGKENEWDTGKSGEGCEERDYIFVMMSGYQYSVLVAIVFYKYDKFSDVAKHKNAVKLNDLVI